MRRAVQRLSHWGCQQAAGAAAHQHHAAGGVTAPAAAAAGSALLGSSSGSSSSGVGAVAVCGGRSLQAAAVLAGGACMQQVQQIGSLASLSKLHASAAAALAGEAQHWEDVHDSSSSSASSSSGASSSSSSSSSGGGEDPFELVRGEVDCVSQRLAQSVVTNVPALATAAEYFFRPGVRGKQLRPTLLLLWASALSDAGQPGPELLLPDLSPPHQPPAAQRRRQQRIAEIAETIHVASLLHDDVLDDAETRRGVLSLNAQAGNKLAILAGDFLLARASVTLASLHNTEIVELLSRVLEHLVTGEVMQMAAGPEQLTSMDYYLDKTYYKTASLMANSARAVALLGSQPREVADLAWQYGRHLGLAFQVVDDLLDMLGSSKQLGKPALNDLRAGIATAPVLLAAQEQPALIGLIRRKFKREGDVGAALALVQDSSGIAQAKALAAQHARLAAEQVAALPATQCPHALAAREALVGITHRVLARSH